MENRTAELQHQTTGMGTHHYWICPKCLGYNLSHGGEIGRTKVCSSCLTPINIVDSDEDGADQTQ